MADGGVGPSARKASRGQTYPERHGTFTVPFSCPQNGTFCNGVKVFCSAQKQAGEEEKRANSEKR